MLNGLHRGFTGCRKFEKAFRILRARLGRVESLGGFRIRGFMHTQARILSTYVLLTWVQRAEVWRLV